MQVRQVENMYKSYSLNITYNLILLMESYSIEQKAGIYNQHLIHNRKKRTMETTDTSDVLPSIQTVLSNQRHNVVRNKLNQTRTEIKQMQAKLQTLNKIKQKYQKKSNQNMTQLQFLNSVKQRALSDAQSKQRIQNQKLQQQLFLRQQTGQLRQTLINERKMAETLLLENRMREAEQERRRRKQEQYLLKKLKELEVQQNEKKVEYVRESQGRSSSRIKDFQQSRLTFAKDNYKNKVLATLRERQKADSVLQQMRQEEEKLMASIKQSEKAMLTSLYNLEKLKPQKNERRARSDRNIKYDNDDKQYESENFQS